MQSIVKRAIVEGQKTACVSRYGAWGDAILITPVFKALKEDGYYVVANLTERSYDILKTDINIDEFLLQETNEIPADDLVAYWTGMAKRYDRFINLNGSIETKLLKIPGQMNALGQDEYNMPKLQRHVACNYNYMDWTMKLAGYAEKVGELPLLKFTEKEEKWAADFRKDIPYLVVIGLSGSSAHKAYPYISYVGNEFLAKHPEATIVTVGDGLCELLEWDHPRVVKKSGAFGIRKSLVLAKHADMVVVGETGLANAASAFDVAKVILLSHSSEENLTKHWKRTIAVAANAPCQPCHKLHYELRSCPLVEEIHAPICMGLLNPNKIIDAMEKLYSQKVTI